MNQHDQMALSQSMGDAQADVYYSLKKTVLDILCEDIVIQPITGEELSDYNKRLLNEYIKKIKQI